jgi:hypothetical protein
MSNALAKRSTNRSTRMNLQCYPVIFFDLRGAALNLDGLGLEVPASKPKS